MPFPDLPRTIFANNPLEEVICQLRFPAVLRIETEPPAAFQESIRAEYPLFDEVPPAGGLSVPEGLPPQFAKLLLATASDRVQRNFTSADRNWKVSLTRDFLALTATQYHRWEEFRDHLAGPLSALQAHYQPAFFTRIGLRYRNVVRRSSLNLAGQPWTELLRPHVAAEFSSPDIRDQIRQAAHQIAIALEEHEAVVQLRHGLTISEGAEASGEECYTIDTDFYTSTETDIQHVRTILDYFNENARRLFLWCISERLHRAMAPQPAVVG